MQEIKLAKKVIDYLSEMRWDIYQEVTYLGKRADIVAVTDRRLWVIECKCSHGFAVMDQAIEWRRYAHYVSVAVPLRRRRGPNSLWFLHNYYGIGLFEVSEWWDVRETIISKVRRKICGNLIDSLHPQHKYMAPAGTANGGYYTPFRNTEYEVKKYLRENPNSTMKEIVNNIKYHYANSTSAIQSLRKWIDKGIIKGINIDKSGNSYIYSLNENKANK